MKKDSKTIESSLYIEVEDSPDGEKIIDELAIWLMDLKHRYPQAYLNGWIGPAKGSKKK